jgi:hypothetical protein
MHLLCQVVMMLSVIREGYDISFWQFPGYVL